MGNGSREVPSAPSHALSQYYLKSPQKFAPLPPSSPTAAVAVAAAAAVIVRPCCSAFGQLPLERRHSVVCSSCSSPAMLHSAAFIRSGFTTTMNDAVFHEVDDGYSESYSSSQGSSPLTHRKVERSHSEPKAPVIGLLHNRELHDDHFGSVSVIKDRYKTELCRAFQEAGHCKYGEKCQFAHGRQDLRSVNRHPKYKTDKCRSFHATGLCQYGARCHFIHHPSEANMAPPAAMMSSSAAAAAAAAARTRSVSLCTFPPIAVTVPRNILGQQTFEVGSCGNSVNDFSSYSSSPASMSPGLNRSFISGEDSFFGSVSNVNTFSSVGYGDEPLGPWTTTLDDLFLDIDK